MTKQEAVKMIVDKFGHTVIDFESLLDFLVDEVGMLPPSYFSPNQSQYIKSWERNKNDTE